MRHICRLVCVLAAMLLSTGVAFPADPNWPATLVIGTASPGGTYFTYGEGLAKILTRELGIPVSARATEGPVQNIALLEKGEIQLAFATLGVALQAWNGTGAGSQGKPFREMRALFPMYDTPFQLVVMHGSIIQSVADLAGKRIGSGPQGGTTATYMPEMLKALKIEAPLIYGDWADLAQQLRTGALDALAVAAGVPFPSFLDLETNGKLRFLHVTTQQIAVLRLTHPELQLSTVPPGIYASLPTPYQTVGLFNFAVGRMDLPDNLVYAILDAVFSHQDELIGTHPAATETVPANFTRNMFLPFHNGADRWYRNHAAGGTEQGD
ncbi:TRAP transporter solute receptor, TAXI family [Methylobacterium sp. 4-46]|uniref:TAXI family TRAP transporter solute-binding subunit n=1 Tax=unclassified Methylobacterium TaxID=2615210 RepID=UPI000152C137|nr:MULTISPECIES: TAXI family TRAP transporter solute-binding subunit [Methylobacterium]ACA15777.1 TRAP transporter solute receptor, TAXI family [Methylobacterium sp. 4-46]WFT81507.1 TAXI family TRAP transporter solute-binding subunit [Methylobacterium nodulans]